MFIYSVHRILLFLLKLLLHFTIPVHFEDSYQVADVGFIILIFYAISVNVYLYICYILFYKVDKAIFMSSLMLPNIKE